MAIGLCPLVRVYRASGNYIEVLNIYYDYFMSTVPPGHPSNWSPCNGHLVTGHPGISVL